MPRVAEVDVAACREPRVRRVFERFTREGREPIALYRVLANAPWLLSAYNRLAVALRYEAALPRGLRELVILRVAQLTGSEYEWSHHRSLAASAGLGEEEVRDLARWRESERFDATARAALACAEAVHGLRVDEDLWTALRERFAPEEAIELVSICAFYEMVARIVQGLGVEVEPEYAPFRPEARRDENHCRGT